MSGDNGSKRGEGKPKKDRPPIGVWLRQLRASKDWSQFDLADVLAVSRSSIGSYETGDDPVPVHVLAKIKEVFPEASDPPTDAKFPDVQPERYGDLKDGKSPLLIRYAGLVPCSDWGDPLTSGEWREVDNAKFVGETRFMCRIVGNSNYPKLRQGDLTIWELDSAPPYGTFVLAEKLDGQECTLKQLEMDPQTQENILVPFNPTCEVMRPREGWKCTARLVGLVAGDEVPERTWFWAPGLRAKHIDRPLPEIVEKMSE